MQLAGPLGHSPHSLVSKVLSVTGFQVKSGGMLNLPSILDVAEHLSNFNLHSCSFFTFECALECMYSQFLNVSCVPRMIYFARKYIKQNCCQELG